MKKNILFLIGVCFVQTVCAVSLYEQSGAAQKYMKGDLPGALQEYNQLIMQDPQNPILNFNMGTVLYKAGKLEQSESYFKRSLQGNVVAIQWLSLANLGNVYAHQKKYDDAIASLEKALTYELKKEDKEKLEYNLEVIKQLKRQEDQQDQKQQDSSDDQKDQDQKSDDQKECDDCQNKQDGDSGDQSENKNEKSDEQNQSEQDQKESDQSDVEKENKNTDDKKEPEQKSSDAQKEQSQKDKEEKGAQQKNVDQKKQESSDGKSMQNKKDQQKSADEKLPQPEKDSEKMDTSQAQQAQVQDFEKSNQELKNALQKELEQNSSDDDRLSVQEAALMDAYDEREDLIGKQVIAKRMAVAQQGGGKHDKNW